MNGIQKSPFGNYAQIGAFGRKVEKPGWQKTFLARLTDLGARDLQCRNSSTAMRSSQWKEGLTFEAIFQAFPGKTGFLRLNSFGPSGTSILSLDKELHLPSALVRDEDQVIKPVGQSLTRAVLQFDRHSLPHPDLREGLFPDLPESRRVDRDPHIRWGVQGEQDL